LLFIIILYPHFSIQFKINIEKHSFYWFNIWVGEIVRWLILFWLFCVLSTWNWVENPNTISWDNWNLIIFNVSTVSGNWFSKNIAKLLVNSVVVGFREFITLKIEFRSGNETDWSQKYNKKYRKSILYLLFIFFYWHLVPKCLVRLLCFKIKFHRNSWLDIMSYFYAKEHSNDEVNNIFVCYSPPFFMCLKMVFCVLFKFQISLQNLSHHISFYSQVDIEWIQKRILNISTITLEAL
jgi:hypothetical protein